MIRRFAYASLLMLGLMIIVVTVTATRVTEGMDSESIDMITKYVFKFNGSQELNDLIMSDVGVMFLMYKVSEYSHWIITLSIIWIVIILYFARFRRINNEEK